MQVYHSDSGNTESLTPGIKAVVTLPYGEYLEFEGDNEHGLYPDTDSAHIVCPENGAYEASGQLSSLAKLDSKEGYSFYGLFSANKGLAKADNLVLPAGYDESEESFASMFYGCINLTQGPKEIPYTSGQRSNFISLFQGCSSLSSAGVVWTQWPDSVDTSNWLYGVSSAGTFYCPSSLEIPSRDENGVPSGWTIQRT